MLTMVCVRALSKRNRAWSCVRSVYKVAWEAMMQERAPVKDRQELLEI